MHILLERRYQDVFLPHLRQVYAFGPPMIAASSIARTWSRTFEVPATELRNADDCDWAACKTPPIRAQSAGKLLLSFSASFGESLDLGNALLSILRGTVAERLTSKVLGALLERRSYVLYDHLPTHYVSVSQLPNRKHITELGGDF